jgi:hypothetical protein
MKKKVEVGWSALPFRHAQYLKPQPHAQRSSHHHHIGGGEGRRGDYHMYKVSPCCQGINV